MGDFSMRNEFLHSFYVVKRNEKSVPSTGGKTQYRKIFRSISKSTIQGEIPNMNFFRSNSKSWYKGKHFW